jgi:hypothetical protein
MRNDRERGFAVIVAMMGLLMISALGAALVLATSIETIIARNYRDAAGAVYAAQAAAAYVVEELAETPDWSSVLVGIQGSTFYDGAPGQRTLADGTTVDLAEILNLANCNQLASCTTAEMSAATAARPWGVNNPRWRIFASGRLADLLGIATRFYVAVFVADDPAETDGDPLTDGIGPGNPGSGLLSLRAEAFGPAGARSAVELTVKRDDIGAPPPFVLRVVSWRVER